MAHAVIKWNSGDPAILCRCGRLKTITSEAWKAMNQGDHADTKCACGLNVELALEGGQLVIFRQTAGI